MQNDERVRQIYANQMQVLFSIRSLQFKHLQLGQQKADKIEAAREARRRGFLAFLKVIGDRAKMGINIRAYLYNSVYPAIFI